jgi:hypothetical protein
MGIRPKTGFCKNLFHLISFNILALYCGIFADLQPLSPWQFLTVLGRPVFITPICTEVVQTASTLKRSSRALQRL